jgi:hypothetical protein
MLSFSADSASKQVFLPFFLTFEFEKPLLRQNWKEPTLNENILGVASSDASMSHRNKERSNVPDCAAASRISDELRSRNFLDIPNHV